MKLKPTRMEGISKRLRDEFEFKEQMKDHLKSPNKRRIMCELTEQYFTMCENNWNDDNECPNFRQLYDIADTKKDPVNGETLCTDCYEAAVANWLEDGYEWKDGKLLPF